MGRWGESFITGSNQIQYRVGHTGQGHCVQNEGRPLVGVGGWQDEATSVDISNQGTICHWVQSSSVCGKEVSLYF